MANVIYGGRDVENRFKRFLNRNTPELTAILLAIWRRQGNRLTSEQINIALQTLDFPMDVYDSWEKDFQAFTEKPMDDKYILAFAAAGRPMARAIARFTRESFLFDPTALYLRSFVANKELNLASQITQTQIRAVKELLVKTIAFKPQGIPITSKEILQQGIGLQWNHANAPMKAFEREFNSQINKGVGERTATKRAKIAMDKKYKQLLRVRGNNIARTEMAQAWSFANHEVVLDAWKRGLFGPGVRLGKEWLTAFDERVCQICEPLDGTIRPLTGMFQVTDVDAEGVRFPVPAKNLIEGIEGETTYAFAHMSCRCTETIIEL